MPLSQVLEIIITAFGAVLLYLLDQTRSHLSRMTESMESLNVKLAVICEKVDTHERRISSLEERKK